MGLFRKKSIEPEQRSIPLDNGFDVVTNSLGTTGFTYNSLRAIQNSDIRKAVQTISNDVSSTPLQFYVNGQVTSNHAYDILLNKRPNQLQDAKSFWFSVMASMLLNGNSYASITRDKQGAAVELQYLPVTDLQVQLSDNGNYIEKYVYVGEGKTIEFNPKDILHFKVFSLDGLSGISPLKSLVHEMELTKKANDSLLSFYNRAVKGNGKVTIKNAHGAGLNKEASRNIRKNFVDLNSPSNADALGIIIVEEDKYDYESIPMETSFLNVINNITFEQKQIAKVFDLPIEKFGMETVNSSSLELNTQYVQNSLRHYMKIIESELSFKLLGDTFISSFVFDTSEIMKPSFKELIEILSVGVKSTLITPNEARAELGYAPINDGDKLITNTAFMDKGDEVDGQGNPN